MLLSSRGVRVPQARVLLRVIIPATSDSRSYSLSAPLSVRSSVYDRQKIMPADRCCARAKVSYIFPAKGTRGMMICDANSSRNLLPSDVMKAAHCLTDTSIYQAHQMSLPSQSPSYYESSWMNFKSQYLIVSSSSDTEIVDETVVGFRWEHMGSDG